MHDELEKIDLIRSRTGVSYKEAREALDAVGGDVVQALIWLEEGHQSPGSNYCEGLNARGQEFMSHLKTVLHRGQETKIKIKRGEDTVLEVPASVGALGILGTLASSQLAVIGALGGLAAMANKYSLEFEGPPEEEPGAEAGEGRQGRQHQGPTAGED